MKVSINRKVMIIRRCCYSHRFKWLIRFKMWPRLILHFAIFPGNISLCLYCSVNSTIRPQGPWEEPGIPVVPLPLPPTLPPAIQPFGSVGSIWFFSSSKAQPRSIGCSHPPSLPAWAAIVASEPFSPLPCLLIITLHPVAWGIFQGVNKILLCWKPFSGFSITFRAKSKLSTVT